jgi:hypothetical protein
LAIEDLDERSQRIWRRLASQVSEGPPRGLAPAVTPFPVWALFVAIVVFIPAALVLSFFIHRHVIAATGSGLVVYHVSFWRMRVENAERHAPGEAGAALEGSKLTVGGETYHLEPGWSDAGEQLVALA